MTENPAILEENPKEAIAFSKAVNAKKALDPARSAEIDKAQERA